MFLLYVNLLQYKLTQMCSSTQPYLEHELQQRLDQHSQSVRQSSQFTQFTTSLAPDDQDGSSDFKEHIFLSIMYMAVYTSCTYELCSYLCRVCRTPAFSHLNSMKGFMRYFSSITCQSTFQQHFQYSRYNCRCRFSVSIVWSQLFFIQS